MTEQLNSLFISTVETPSGINSSEAAGAPLLLLPYSPFLTHSLPALHPSCYMWALMSFYQVWKWILRGISSCCASLPWFLINPQTIWPFLHSIFSCLRSASLLKGRREEGRLITNMFTGIITQELSIGKILKKHLKSLFLPDGQTKTSICFCGLNANLFLFAGQIHFNSNVFFGLNTNVYLYSFVQWEKLVCGNCSGDL